MVLNDGMDDFAIPGKANAYNVTSSEVNYIKRYKMPLSSMCPSLLMDTAKNKVILSIGAAGGSRITTAVAYVRFSDFDFFRKKSVNRLLGICFIFN